MKAFEVKGQFRISVRQWQPFTIEVATADESAAIDKTFSLIGSRHNVKRQFVKIDGVRDLKKDEVTDHRVRHILEGGDV